MTTFLSMKLHGSFACFSVCSNTFHWLRRVSSKWGCSCLPRLLHRRSRLTSSYASGQLWRDFADNTCICRTSCTPDKSTCQRVWLSPSTSPHEKSTGTNRRIWLGKILLSCLHVCHSNPKHCRSAFRLGSDKARSDSCKRFSGYSGCKLCTCGMWPMSSLTSRQLSSSRFWYL